MQLFIYTIISVSLLYQTVWGRNLGSFFRADDDDVDESTFPTKEIEFSSPGVFLNNNNDNYENKTLEDKMVEGNFESARIAANDSSEMEEINSPVSNSNLSFNSENSTSEIKNESMSTTSTINKVQAFTKDFNNETHSSISADYSSFTTSSFVQGSNKSGIKTTSFVTTSDEPNKSSLYDEEPEGVVIVKPSNPVNETIVASFTKSLYQKSLELITDTYTLSILIPVAAGVLFATTIILTIAICRCLKRKCRRRRFHRKALPDSVKNLRPSDRARLLAESSDEEF